MFFKIKPSLKYFTLLVASIFIITSCSYFFEEKKEAIEVDISSEDTQCLTQTAKVFKRFIKSYDEAESIDASLNNQIACINSAITKFSSYVKSGEGDGKSYNPQEILNVLGIFFKDESLTFDLSLSFIENFLKIKEFLIGGSSRSLTKKELSKMNKLVSVFGQLFLDIRPYRKILFDSEFQLQRTLEERDHFDDAFLQLRDSTNDILKVVKKWGGDKPLDLFAVGEFLLRTYFDEKYDSRKKYLELYIEFKKFVLNEGHPYVKRRDFNLLVHQTLRVYYSVFEYNHFVRDGELFDSLGDLASFIVKVPDQLSHGDVLKTMSYSSLSRIYDRGAETLIYATRRGPRQRIAMDKVEGLLKAMERVGYLGKFLTANSLSIFISNLANGWMVDDSLRVNRNGSYSYRPYLTEAKVFYTLKHLNEWQERQEFIRKNLDGKPYIKLSDIELDKQPSNIKNWIELLLQVHLKHWKNVGNGDSKDYRLIFDKTDQYMNFEELTASNSVYTESIFFMQPFQARKAKRKNYSINEDQTQAIYELMRSIGIELAFMDSRIYDTGRRAFVEANLFTTRKRADDRIDIGEGYELMNYMYNNGILSEQIYKDLPVGDKLESLDVLRKKLINTIRFREFLRRNYPHYFQQLPGIKNYWDSLNDKKRNEFLNTLEKAVRGGVLAEEIPFDMGAIRVLIAVTYYLESIFHNFESDSDQDELATSPELIKAQKHFHSHLHKIVEESTNSGRSPGDPEWQAFDEDYVDNLFYYILAHKELPDPDSTWHQLWVASTGSGQVVSRGDALHVFSILADVGRKNVIGRIRGFLEENQTRLLHEVDIIEEVPKCHKRKVLFCQWARFLQCNTDVYEHLFKQMKVSKFRFSSDGDTQDDDTQKTLVELQRLMHKDSLLLTKCGYPYIERLAEPQSSSD